jgi:glutamyl-tRNA reductase
MVALSEPAAGLPELLLVGASGRGPGEQPAERLFREERMTAALLDRLAAAGFREALALVTGDRCELYVTSRDPGSDAPRLKRLLAEAAPAEPVASEPFSRSGAEALAHLFALAAALDGPPLDGPELLDRLQAAHKLAADRGLAGGDLEAALQAAYAAAKRVRSETPLAEKPISMAAAAVQIAQDLHGALGGASALLIGAGDLGQLLADELRRAGLRELTVLHPALARAELMARQHRCHFRPWEELDAALAGADIVLSGLGMGREVVSAEAVRRALRQRRLRPMLLMDLSVPSDVERAAGELADAFRYDVDDLERIAMRGPQGRIDASAAGRAIIDAELAAFAARRAERAPLPALAQLRTIFEAERDRALAAADGDAETATRLLVERLLERPSARLRALAATRGREAAQAELLALVRRLFAEAPE